MVVDPPATLVESDEPAALDVDAVASDNSGVLVMPLSSTVDDRRPSLILSRTLRSFWFCRSRKSSVLFLSSNSQ